MRTYKWSSFQKQQSYTDSWRDYINSPPLNPHGWYGLVKEQYDKQLLSEGIARDPLDDPELLEELFGRKRGWEREVEKWDKEDAEKAAAAKAGKEKDPRAKEGGADWGAAVEKGSRGATAPGEYKATWWEKAKGVMAKMGTLEKSGKFLPGARGKAYADAKERLAAAAEKAAAGLVNRDLAGLMKQKYPEFPNMRTNEEFRDALLDVGTIYDSVVASTQKDPQDPEYLDAVSANYIIAYLREFTQHNLDNELKDAYKHFKENKELEEAAPFKGVADQNVARRTPAGTPDTPGVGAPEGPKGKYTQRAAKKGSHSDASTTIQGLKSNTLPAILGLLGAAASGAAGYVAMTTSVPPPQPGATEEEIWKTVSQSVETNVGLAADPNGTLAMFANGAGDPQNFQDIAGNIDKIAAAGGITPDEVISTYSDVAMMGEESEVALKAVYEWGKQGGDISAWGAGGGVPTAEFQEFVTANPAFKDIHEYVSQTGFGAGTGVASDAAAGAAGGAVETVGDFANAGFSSDQLDQIANRAHEIFKDDLVTGYRGAATSATSAGVADPGAAPSPQALRSAIDNALQSVKGGTTDLGVPLEGTASGDQWTAIGRAANELGGGEGGAGMERLLGLDADKVMAVGSTVSTITFKVFMGMGTRAAAAAAGAGAAGALGIGAAAAPILGALGIAGITGGIAVKLIRMKGLKSSRAQMMGDLLDEMQDVPVPEPVGPVKPPKPVKPVKPVKPADPCDKVIDDLMNNFKVGDVIRYIQERGTGNITGADIGTDAGGAGGETLITTIIEMPTDDRQATGGAEGGGGEGTGEGTGEDGGAGGGGTTPEDATRYTAPGPRLGKRAGLEEAFNGPLPSIADQMKSENWEEEKVIFIRVRGMVPLEAGQRAAPSTNIFRAAAIRDCKLNIKKPDESEIRSAWQAAPKAAEKLGLPRPGDIAGGMGEKEVQNVFFDKLKKKAQNLGLEGNLRPYWAALRDTATTAGSPQKFHMRTKAGRKAGTQSSDLREVDEATKYIPLVKLWSAWKKVFAKTPIFVGKTGNVAPSDDPSPAFRILTRAAVETDVLIGYKGKKLKLRTLPKLKLVAPRGGWGVDRGDTPGSPTAAPKKAAGYKARKKPEGPTHTVSESKRRALTEAKQNEAWDKLTSRWKDLSGIK